MKRVVLLVMDSVGIGGAEDAGDFGGEGYSDAGANTLGHIAAACARGDCDGRGRRGALHIPNLDRLGIGAACQMSSGARPEGVGSTGAPDGASAWAREISSGKDTPSGHWELAGVPVLFEWSYFPDVEGCFPDQLLEAIASRSGVCGGLGNRHASGTEIIAQLGGEHLRTGEPIYYTSADSVFQVACHEGSFGLGRLYELCEAVRAVLDESELRVGRVIARPFVGSVADGFERTGNRRDYSVPPPAETVLQKLLDAGSEVVGIGKIGDIYAGVGIGEERRASGHGALWAETLSALERLGDRGMLMTNFVDFDALYGHRRDVPGYAAALEAFDAALPELYRRLGSGDLLIITADHGNDPTWPGTDHTRENVPVLLRGAGVAAGASYGDRRTFADVGQTIARFFSLPEMEYGTPILP